MDLILELLMAGVLLIAGLGACRKGNPWPCFWTAVGGFALSVLAMIRNLEASDIFLPMIVGLIAAIIGVAAHGFRPRAQRPADGD